MALTLGEFLRQLGKSAIINQRSECTALALGVVRLGAHTIKTASRNAHGYAYRFSGIELQSDVLLALWDRDKLVKSSPRWHGTHRAGIEGYRDTSVTFPHPPVLRPQSTFNACQLVRRVYPRGPFELLECCRKRASAARWAVVLLVVGRVLTGLVVKLLDRLNL